MAGIPFPLSNTPGLRPQDGAGRLINVYAEPRGEGQGAVWRRVPGARRFSGSVAVIEFTGTATVTFVGVNRQGALSATGTGSPTFVGST